MNAYIYENVCQLIVKKKKKPENNHAKLYSSFFGLFTERLENYPNSVRIFFFPKERNGQFEKMSF